jgi:hypothetical protein
MEGAAVPVGAPHATGSASHPMRSGRLTLQRQYSSPRGLQLHFLMKPVKVVCGVIHEANRLLRPDGVIPGDCARLTQVTGGEPFTVSLLWSPLDVNIMLYVWLCAPERYRPAS